MELAQEKRQYSRFRVPLKLAYQLRTTHFVPNDVASAAWTAECHDVSAGGLCFKVSSKSVSSGDVLKVNLDLGFLQRPINAWCAVKWLRQSGEENALFVGMEFVGLTEKDCHRLNQFIAQWRSREAPEQTKDKVEWILRQGREILYLELHQAGPEAYASVQRVRDLLAQRPDFSTPLLLNLCLSRYQPLLALKWQKQQKLLDQKCTRGALFGQKSHLFKAISIFLKIASLSGFEFAHRIKIVENQEQAVAWLLEER